MDDERVQLTISGRVQGVFYRASTQAKAQELRLTGWVRNLVDGRVEVVAEGPRQALEALVAWCEQGPSYARVDMVEQLWLEATGEFEGFRVSR